MTDKNTKNESRFKRIFGAGKKEQTADDIDIIKIFEQSENPQNMPDIPAESAEVSADVSAPEETEKDADIEKDAKEYYNSNHSRSIEDKIRSLHENAMQSYAKDVSAEAETEEISGQPALDDDAHSAVGTEDESEQKDKMPAASGETKNYDMSQLIEMLKGHKTQDDDADESGADEYAEDEEAEDIGIGLHDSELYDDVNEYYHDFEYTEKAQGNALFAGFRKSAVVSSLSVVLTLLATIACIWLELGHAAGLPFSDMMHPGRYGRIYAMLSLQMLTLGIFFNLDGLARGIRKLSLKRPAPEAGAVLAVAACAIHAVVTAITAYESTSYRTFCFAGCFVLLILSINTFIKAYTRFKAFAMVLSKKPKLITQSLDHLAEEYSAFAKYLSEDSEALAVSKTDTVSDFVKRTYTVPKATSACNVLLYSVLAVSIAASLIGAFLLKMPAYEAFTGGIMIFLFSTPVSMLAATSLPYFAASARASALHASILGEAAGDSYENAGVLSFDDTEVFPPKAVKVTSIKTYNDHRIDKIIVYMAKIFDKLGGPLSYVFASSLQEFSKDESDVMVLETSPDGLHLKIGDDDVLVGTGGYMRLYDIETPADSIDETEMRSLTSILFLVCNNRLAAKFYIRYALNRNFEAVLRGMYDAGVCCGVRTFDPGIDDQLIEGNLKGGNYPIHVIKKESKSVGRVEEALSGGIVSLSSVHNFLKTFILVDRLGGIYKSNTVMAILSSLIGLVVSVCLFFTGTAVSLSVLLLFQIFWLLPPVILSIFGK